MGSVAVRAMRGRHPRAVTARHAGARPAVIHAARVAARSPGLAAFYAGLEKALARPTAPADAADPGSLWPVAPAQNGVLSRTGALALAVALLALALLLAFAVVPRVAAVRVLSSGGAARESIAVTLATAAVCAFLAVLLVHAAL
jgi:hypothetical protein